VNKSDKKKPEIVKKKVNPVLPFDDGSKKTKKAAQA
jgi:hypothetical protein